MAGRIVELRWACGECDTEGILGRHKQCPQCGAPRERGEMDMSGLSADGSGAGLASVTDEALLDLATAGADWFCGHCEAGNRGDGDACATCGAPRADAGAGPGFAPVDPELLADAVGAAAGVTFGTVAAIGMALLGCAILCSGVVWWAMQTEEVDGQVTALRWRHATVRQTWTPVTRSGWKSDLRERAGRPPVDGRGEVAGVAIQSCRDKHHHDERYACGTKQVCTPKTRTESYACGETCVDNGNGFATCTPRTCTRTVPDGQTCRTETEYCSRPVYAPYCSYRTEAWVDGETAVASGEGHETRWKTLDPGPRDRIVRRPSYMVEVEAPYEDGALVHTIKLADERRYRRFELGAPLVLDVGRRGGVRGVRRPGSEVPID